MYTFNEGDNRTVQLILCNISTQDDIYVPARLITTVEAVLDNNIIIPATSYTDDFLPGEIKLHYLGLSVPYGTAGSSGTIDVIIESPNSIIASDSIYFQIANPVNYITTFTYGTTVAQWDGNNFTPVYDALGADVYSNLTQMLVLVNNMWVLMTDSTVRNGGIYAISVSETSSCPNSYWI